MVHPHVTCIANIKSLNKNAIAGLHANAVVERKDA